MLLFDPAQQLGSGVILGIAHDFYAATGGDYFIALWNTVAGVIGSLHLDVGPDLANEGAHIRFIEDHHGIHASERGNDLGTLLLRHGGTPRTFETARAGI